jgi:glycosyltransferase involved in cell wall biosynthesis
MPTVALVNASARTDGISYSGRAFRWALRELGYGVVWYQCVDHGQDSRLAERDRVVPGLGIPSATADMGINRLWVFPRRLRDIPEDIVFLMDPTLVNVSRLHRRTAVRFFDVKPLTPFADRRASTWMFRYAIPRLRRVRRVLVPTVTTAVELTARGIPPDRIRVVPETHSLGVHPDHIGISLERIRTTGVVRVLYVATDRPYKNLGFVIRLAQASARMSGRKRLEFTLLSRLRPETSAYVSRLNLPNLSIVPEVGSVADMYGANDVLVFPSLHEGFGRPVIEAMAFGMPIIVSNIFPLKEIVGDSGSLLDPGSVEPWMEMLGQLTEPSFYEAAARRSWARGEDYSPVKFREAVKKAFEDM